MTKTLIWSPITKASNSSSNGRTSGALYKLTLNLSCSDGFSASTHIELDAADYLLFNECVRFAVPHLLGLHGAFRLPIREDYAQDM